MKTLFMILSFIVSVSVNLMPQGMTVESTKKIMVQYFNSEHSDVSIMAADVVFRHMATGEEYHSPDSVLQMLNYFYRTAFDATGDIKILFMQRGSQCLKQIL